MTEKNIKKKKFCRPYVYYGLWIFLGVLLIVALVYGVTLFKNNISGRAVFKIQADYQEGQPLEGNLRLSLKEGELIPSSSKIIFETSGQKYEYDLSEVISDNLVEGDFYVKGKSISGTGLGYGTKGTKTIYPKVYFTLGVYSQTSSEEDEEEEIEPEEEVEEESEVEETPEETELEEEPEEEVEVEMEIEEEVELEEEVEEEVELEEEVEEEEITPITGNIISRLSEGVSNFFLGLTKLLRKISNFFLGLTGRVSLEFETEVEGEVLADQPFTYNLQEGQTAEIVSSSQSVDLDVENGVATVTTSYSEEEQGFGEDYLGDTEKVLDIDLSGLDLIFGQEELKISMVYREEEIVSLTTLLKEGEIIKDEAFAEESQEEVEAEQNITSNETFLNETEKIIEEVTSDLTNKEREILIDEFGNTSIKIIKAELVGERIIVRYGLGSYWIEYSYNADAEDLDSLMETDRIKWLKDIVNTLSQKEAVPEEFEELIGRIYPIQ